MRLACHWFGPHIEVDRNIHILLQQPMKYGYSGRGYIFKQVIKGSGGVNTSIMSFCGTDSPKHCLVRLIEISAR